MDRDAWRRNSPTNVVRNETFSRPGDAPTSGRVDVPHPEVYLATEGEGVLEGLVSTGVPFVEQGVNGGCKSFSMVFGITEISFPS